MESAAAQNAELRKRRAGVDRPHSPPADAAGETQRCPLCDAPAPENAAPEGQPLQCAACGTHYPHRASAIPNPDETTPAPRIPLGGGGWDGSLESWFNQSPDRPRLMADRDHVRRWRRKHHWKLTAAVGLAAVLVVLAIGGTAGAWYAAMRANDLDARHGESQQCLEVAEQLASDRLAQLREKETALDSALAARKTAEDRLAAVERRLSESETRRSEAEKRQANALVEARTKLAGQLAEQSRLLLADQPVHSALLAGASADIAAQAGRPVDRAVRQTLRDALSAVGPQGLKGHRQAVGALAVSSDGRWLLSGSADKTARLWDLTRPDPAADAIVLAGHEGPVTAAAFSPNRRWLVTASQDATAMLRDLQTADPTAAPIVLRGHRARINAVAFSADSRWLVTAGGDFGSQDDVARLWDLDARDPAQASVELRGHQRPILAAAISPEGRWVVTAGEDRTIRLFALAAKFPAAEQRVLRGHEGWVTCLAISPDGRWLASGSYDNTVRLWDLAAADPSSRSVPLSGHQGWIAALAFSPDGRLLATGSYDTTARLWNLDFRKASIESVVLSGHEGQVRAVAFSPDGQRLITGSIDKTARLWDLAGGDAFPGAVVVRSAGPIGALVVSPDGRWFAAAGGDNEPSADGAIRLWELSDRQLVQTARAAGARIAPDQRRSLIENAARDAQPRR